MKRTNLLFLAALAVAALRCATTTAPSPGPPLIPETRGQDRYLIDPRIGFDQPAPPKVETRFESGWRAFQAGDSASARMVFDQIRKAHPEYLPATLGLAAIDIRDGHFDRATLAVDRAQAKVSSYTAAEVYTAEIAARQSQLKRAYDIYSGLATQIAVPDIVKDRYADIRERYFEELSANARAATGPDANRILREALTINPAARDLRMQLVRNLLAQKNWDEARTTLDPLVNTEANKSDVQESLAEIEVGHGQYEQAIQRYEMLSKRERDPRYANRLNELKARWTEDNMPPQFRKAMESEVATRADLAVLLYWKLAPIRFAQNVGTPPIAIDVENATGREEIVRAIALGILQVDPVTRRVGPNSPVTASALTRYAARVLVTRGATCARGTTDAHSALTACNVNDVVTTLPPDEPVSGRVVSDVVDQIDRALSK
ncbi:MAG TPA: tetratricopeptide repeat protein [Thermoanaerobaculia bacterium]|nr:tetratricopeptide repeat protein [Thermoanaerobaculia bacterium]